MLVMRIHCSNSLPTPFGVVSILFPEPKGEGAQPRNRNAFFFVSFFSNAMGFSSMDSHCSQALLLCVYMHYNKCYDFLPYSFTFLPPLNTFHSISVIKFRTITIWLLIRIHIPKALTICKIYFSCYFCNQKKIII